MNKRIPNIFLSRIPYWIILPLVLSAILLTGVALIERRDLHNAEMQYKLAAHTEAQRSAAVLTSGFTKLKGNLVLIGSLLTSRHKPNESGSLLSEQAMEVVIRNIADDIDVAGIYAFEIGFREDGGIAESKTLIRYTTGDYGYIFTGSPEGRSEATHPAGRGIFNHLERIVATFPPVKASDGDGASATGIMDEPHGKHVQNTVDDRRLYYYAVPFYGQDRRLQGIVAAVIPVMSIRAQLFPYGQALIVPGHSMPLTPFDDGPWHDSLKWIRKRAPNPNLIYSEVLPLNMDVSDHDWLFWAGQPDSMFWTRNDVSSTRSFLYLGTAGSIFVGLLLSFFLWLVRRHQLMLATQNRQLESGLVSLRESEAKSTALLKALPDIMLRVKTDGTIIDKSLPEGLPFPGFLSDTRKATLHQILPRGQVRLFIQHAATAIRTGQWQLLEYCWRDRKSLRHYEARVVPYSADEVLTIVRDVTDRKKAESKIRQLAFSDTLTGLANRQAFMQHLRECIQTAQRTGETLAMLFIDLDQFKRVNDSLGHFVGDQLIMAVARRLVNCIRKNDSVGHDVAGQHDGAMARLGGDEFTVLLRKVQEPDAAGQVAQRLVKALAQPIHVDDHEIFISPSIGIAMYPNDGSDEITLLKHADMAMYYAKEQGRNNYQYYVDSMSVRVQERLTLENELRKAIEQQQLSLYFQPQIDVRCSRVVGIEALLRWYHPTLGYIAPDRFIPVAEDTGLIIEIGGWVIHEACRHYKEWQTCGIAPGRIAINVSGQQLIGATLGTTIASALRSSGLQAEVLELELTESSLIRNANEAKSCLQLIKDLGVSIALDDFGTGYSSLNYLRQFPIDRVKIDRSFISDITVDPDDVAIIRAILSMARILGIDVVAEGVETNSQAAFLKGEGCDVMQGYLFSKPVDAKILTSILHADHDPEQTDADVKVHRLFDSV